MLCAQVEYVWKSPLSSVKVMFICVRYGTIIVNIINAMAMLVTGLSTQACYVLVNVFNWLPITEGVSVTVIIALRTRALYNGKTRMVTFLKCAAMLNILIGIAVCILFTCSIQLSSSPELAEEPCLPRVALSPTAMGVSILGFANLAWYNLTIFVMTSVECVKLLRMKRTRLVWRIFRDSVGYYVIIEALTITNLITYGTIIHTHPGLEELFPVPARVLQAIFISRILVRLRQTADKMGDPSMLVQDFSMYEMADVGLALRRP